MHETMGFVSNTWRMEIALETFFDEHGTDVWERNWMILQVQTTLLNIYTPKSIAAILKALREQLKSNDQSSAVEANAAPVPEILIEYEHILEDGGGFSDDEKEDMCQKISCWLPDVKRLHVYMLKVSTTPSQCKGVRKQI